MAEDTVTISVERFEELRKIEENQDKIKMSGGSGGVDPRIFMVSEWIGHRRGCIGNATAYVGKDEAIKVVVEETNRIAAELAKVETERDKLKEKVEAFESAFKKFREKSFDFFNAVEPKKKSDFIPPVDEE
ncbi:MAG: hypothetical protein KKB59_10360 [Spirochaetes bacterium]|nr:hypothetical protein [Spirochaetota bacterium]